ncbi:cation diffusion facilitator family transporter [Fervidobacterium thailandense]|uniref:Cation transporter n=1 Tax=Fervidobacterium thailandense TaxID=1008305 RepID=A0A1E3G106_9BACT|nr:cation diffusion facilitator family transporter [Fervidobacterium thailandense]ODN29926.1 hypothetical protein A4H02_07930 [Fervidobacterium thailandense]
MSHQDHGHTDHHEHINGDLTIARFTAVVLLNLGITLAEIVGGMISRSLLLISDAFHNLTDALAVLTSYVALRISEIGPNKRSTFGYKRANVVVAFVNSSVLLVLIAFIIRESFERLLNPQRINTGVVLVIGCIGLLGNVLSLALLHRGSRENMNVRSAFLHMLSDTISSVSVILGAIFIDRFKVYWLDSILTLLVASFVVRESFGLVLKSLNILTQRVPKGFDIEKLAQILSEHPMVENVHHVHLWALDDKNVHFEAHVNLKADVRLSETMEIQRELESILEKRGVTHVTLQFEYNGCPGCGLVKYDEHAPRKTGHDHDSRVSSSNVQGGNGK